MKGSGNSGNRLPSQFTLKYQVAIVDEEYRALHRFVLGELVVNSIGIAVNLIDVLPESFEVPDESFRLMIFSIAAGFTLRRFSDKEIGV
jgi:hypothetical protein